MDPDAQRAILARIGRRREHQVIRGLLVAALTIIGWGLVLWNLPA